MTAAAVASLAAARDTRGRFQPGCSGNPQGKRPGTLNHATILKRLMAEGDDERIGQQILDRALKGEWRAERFVFERLEPKPRSRPIALDFPEGATVGQMGEIVLRAMASGEISPEEALQVARYLDKLGKLRAAEAPARPAESRAPSASPAVEATPLHSACMSTPPASLDAEPEPAATPPRSPAPAWPGSRRRRAAASEPAAGVPLPLAAVAASAGRADSLQRACILQR
jgi:hypothetical protein